MNGTCIPTWTVFSSTISGPARTRCRGRGFARLEDARAAVYPRDLICLLQEAIPAEQGRVREGQRTADDAVLSRQSLSDALEPTSRQRVEAVREEFPELVDTLEKLRGLNSSGPIEKLKERVVAPDMIDLLTEAGV